MPPTATPPVTPKPVPTPIYRKQNSSTQSQPIVKLNKTLVYRELALELVGTLSVTAANNTQANLAAGDEWASLQNIQIQANGSDVFRNFSGEALWWMNLLWYGQAPEVTATLGDGATLNPTFDSSLIIPFWMPQTYHPFDTLLDAGRFNDLSFIPTYAAPAQVNSAATGLTVQTNLVSQEQVLPTNPNDVPKLNWVSKTLSNVVAGANSAFRVPLDAGVNYARFLFNVKNTTGTADAGSTGFATAPTALISNVKVVGAGGRVYADHPASEIIQTFKLRRHLPQTVTRRSANSNYGAWFEIDLCADGRLTEAMPNPADAYIEFNVLAACQLNVWPQIVFPTA